MNDTDLTDTELIILEYMASGRDLIMEGKALLARVRERTADRASARKMFDGLRREIERARWFATTAEYAGCAESLLGLANDYGTLREEARALL